MISMDTLAQKNNKSSVIEVVSDFSVQKNNNPILPLKRDMDWLNRYISRQVYLRIHKDNADADSIPLNEIQNRFVSFVDYPERDTSTPYGKFLVKEEISNEERLIILTAIAPFFSAGLLRLLCYDDASTNKPYAEFGGIIQSEKEFIPTIDTMRFLIAKGDVAENFNVDNLFNENSKLLSKNIIELKNQNSENTYWNKQTVHPTDEFLALIRDEKYEPSFNSNFPASKIGTKLAWDDLVLPYDTMQELNEISVWLKHRHTIMEHPHLGRIIKPGFRSLFYGPPGTGKTLTASLLGKNTGLDVYRVDLSMVVSKWVGETEKNLKGIFDQAQNKNWILFFDEADSLFGKRTQNKSSNDRHANQEVAYLLQRIEDFPGLVLLATNLKDNIDEAFARRFQSMVNFPIPDAETRLTLWQNTIPKDFILEDTIDLYKIAEEHEVAGGIIINVIRYCALLAIDRGDKIFLEEDIEVGIARELRKSGKIVG